MTNNDTHTSALFCDSCEDLTTTTREVDGLLLCSECR